MSDASSFAFRLDPLLSQLVPPAVATLLAPPLEHMLSLRRLERHYARLSRTLAPAEFAAQALQMLQVQFTAAGALAQIPASGPLVVVANHPFGGIEGLGLFQLLGARRTDVRILGNQLLGRAEQLRPILFAVDVFGGAAATRANAAPMRRALQWVKNGGALLVFPAGEVSSFDPVTRAVVDPPWQPTIGRLARLAGAQVLPIYVEGRNSPLFHIAGRVHPRLRTALLPREVFNKRNRCIRVQVGRPVTVAQIDGIDSDAALTEQLRVRVYALAAACADAGADAGAAAAAVELGLAMPAAVLAAEIAALDAGQRLGTSAGLEVWHACAADVPLLMQEIGRLREATFRAVGEGTGRARDVDLFDRYYEQLFVWNPVTNEIVGGYRIGHADRILRRYGVRGLYTSTLFRYHKALLPSLGPALELGRSFVRQEYQRNFAPLLLLWRGIAAYLLKYPRYRALFGPVSISNDYTTASRAVLTGWLAAQHGDRDRRGLAQARTPLVDSPHERQVRSVAQQLGSIDAVEALLNAFEPDGKGVPVLLRQYLKLGAKTLGFNVDASFGRSVDVLIAVNLDAVDARVLARYMGAAGAAQFSAARSGSPLPAAPAP